DQFEQKILTVLEERNGSIAMTSKSDADEIVKIFAMSKKSFKRALNSLKEKKVIDLNENGMSMKSV
ncbi:MAG: hypothetical protein DRG30_04150, partial [Epsilonproteobacteria bacterium]